MERFLKKRLRGGMCMLGEEGVNRSSRGTESGSDEYPTEPRWILPAHHRTGDLLQLWALLARLKEFRV